MNSVETNTNLDLKTLNFFILYPSPHQVRVYSVPGGQPSDICNPCHLLNFT